MPQHESGCNICCSCRVGNVRQFDIQQSSNEHPLALQDLAVLVNDQGVMLDDIESNIERVADRTRAAGGELQKAERYQRSSRNKMCIILLVVAFVLAVIIIVSVI